jgi:hypothetical protein
MFSTHIKTDGHSVAPFRDKATKKWANTHAPNKIGIRCPFGDYHDLHLSQY